MIDDGEWFNHDGGGSEGGDGASSTVDGSAGGMIGSQEIDETIPPRPWEIKDRIIFDAEGKVVVGYTCGAPTDATAALIVDVVNIFDREGWLEPVTEFQEKLYTTIVELERTNAQLSATIIRAIQLIDEDRASDFPSASEILDTLIDVLSGGGGRGYVPCRYPIIPNIGEEGYCVAHATDEFEDVRYCKAHASLLRDLTVVD